MLLDHIGVIGRAFLSKNVYFLLRAVGRLSFPLFCFILAEGFFHTKNRKKYQQRLFIFALLSEIPYDLAFHYLPASTLNSVLHLQKLSLTDFSAAFQEQNVLFTLFLGFTAMILMENASQYRQNAFYRNFDILIIFCCLSEVFQTDCGAAGILCIYFFYSIYKKRGPKQSGEMGLKMRRYGKGKLYRTSNQSRPHRNFARCITVTNIRLSVSSADICPCG